MEGGREMKNGECYCIHLDSHCSLLHVIDYSDYIIVNCTIAMD